MKQQNRKTGRRGETEAARYLQDKGYKIVEQNFGNKYGEIDLIAKKQDVTVFVEVKTKIGDLMGTPEEMVGKGKLNKIRNMASVYLEGRTVPCRIDVVAIVMDIEGRVERLTHYENVY